MHWLQLLPTISNCAAVPVIVLLLRQGRHVEVCLYICLAVASFAYHSCTVLHGPYTESPAACATSRTIDIILAHILLADLFSTIGMLCHHVGGRALLHVIGIPLPRAAGSAGALARAALGRTGGDMLKHSHILPILTVSVLLVWSVRGISVLMPLTMVMLGLAMLVTIAARPGGSSPPVVALRLIPLERESITWCCILIACAVLSLFLPVFTPSGYWLFHSLWHVLAFWGCLNVHRALHSITTRISVT